MRVLRGSVSSAREQRQQQRNNCKAQEVAPRNYSLSMASQKRSAAEEVVAPSNTKAAKTAPETCAVYERHHLGNRFYTIVPDFYTPPPPASENSFASITVAALFRERRTGEVPSEVAIFTYQAAYQTCLPEVLEEESIQEKLKVYTLIAYQKYERALAPRWELNDSQQPHDWEWDELNASDWVPLHSPREFNDSTAIYSNARHFNQCRNARASRRDWQSYFVAPKSGLWHPKVWCLRFSKFVRLIIASRNIDGGSEKDVCWVTDLELNPDGDGSSFHFLQDDAFGNEFDDFILSSTNKAVHQRVRQIFRDIKRDVLVVPREMRVSLLASYGKAREKSRGGRAHGMTLLQSKMATLNWVGGVGEPSPKETSSPKVAPVHITSCFVGNCRSATSTWWQDLLCCVGVNEHATRLIFPAYRDVYELETFNGFHALGIYVRDDAANDSVMRDWREEMGHFLRRIKLKDKHGLYHIKMMSRFPSAAQVESNAFGESDVGPVHTVAWVILGSHNCSDAAWGPLNGRPNNCECSVLLSTYSYRNAAMWKRDHPFDVDNCPKYNMRARGKRKWDDNPFTWGKALFRFQRDEIYRRNPDQGRVACEKQLALMAKNFRSDESRYNYVEEDEEEEEKEEEEEEEEWDSLVKSEAREDGAEWF